MRNNIVTAVLIGLILFQLHQTIAMRRHFHNIDLQLEMDDVDIKNLIGDPDNDSIKGMP